MDRALHEEIAGKIRAAQRILVVSHVRPDGDAVGSLVAMGLGLQEVGKNVTMVLNDGVPIALRYIVQSDQIVKKPEGEYDLIILVDCADLDRAGKVIENYSIPDINIDHHITNLHFAKINLIEPDSVATCAILAKYMPLWGLPLTHEVAAALMSGLVSDTIGFRTSNMTPEALRIGAQLMELGADLPHLYNHALVRRSYSAARYWGAGLSHLERKGDLIWSYLSLADREISGYPGNDDADLVNVLSAIEEGVIVVLFIEQKGGKVKISWRSQPGYDVSKIAVQFGGGGHPAAAGADVSGTLGDVQDQVLQATEQLLSEVNQPEIETG